MTIQSDTELAPLTRLDFDPRCTLPCLLCDVEHPCTHKAVVSARFPHGVLQRHEPTVHLLCGCCLTLLMQAVGDMFPRECRCGHRFGCLDEFITDVRPLS